MHTRYFFGAILSAGILACPAPPSVHCSQDSDCPEHYQCTNSYCLPEAQPKHEDAATIIDAGEAEDTSIHHDSSITPDAVGTTDAARPDTATPDAYIDCGACTDPLPYCDGRTGLCVACLQDKHCPNMGNPCLNAGFCSNGACAYPLADDGTLCDQNKVCALGQCVSCLTCPRDPACTQRDFCEVQEPEALVFSQLTALTGLGPNEYRCGFVQGDGTSYALCSRPTPETHNDDKLRPHVFTSSDGLSWTWQHSMVDNPPKYWNGSTWTAAYTNYFRHNSDFPVRLNDGSFLDAATGYFAWFDGEWVPFAPYWHSADFMSWSGYYGDTGSEGLVVSWGHWHPAVGAAPPSLYVKQNGDIVAYVREAPNTRTPEPRYPFRFHRLTSTDRGYHWTEDENFLFDTDPAVYRNRWNYGRIFAFADQRYTFLPFNNDIICLY